MLTKSMLTYNESWFPCPPAEAYRLAVQVDRWPLLLPHYRWVRFHQGSPEDGGLVEMAAWRAFGRLPWPIWWMSQMSVDPEARTIRYTHVAGVTEGMEVLWQVEPAGSGSRVTIHHQWEKGPHFCGPLAPAVGRGVVGPLFVHHVAGQTLRHLAGHTQRGLAG